MSKRGPCRVRRDHAPSDKELTIKGNYMRIDPFEIVSNPKVKWSELATKKFKVLNRKRRYGKIMGRTFEDTKGIRRFTPIKNRGNKVLCKTYRKVLNGTDWDYVGLIPISRYKLKKYLVVPEPIKNDVDI